MRCKEFIPILMILIMFGVTAYYYDQLPEEVTREETNIFGEQGNHALQDESLGNGSLNSPVLH